MSSSSITSPTILCVLDGFGLGKADSANAIHLASTPNFDRLLEQYPSTTLITHGERVGLPEGQMGNSEVGHLNLGAGRTVEQWLLHISKQLQNNSLDHSEELRSFLNNCKKNSTLHLAGLYSKGGVHSHMSHLFPLLKTIRKTFSGEVCLHLFTDGRDADPGAAIKEIQQLEQDIATDPHIKIATIIGRFYAMDRDKRWDRTEKAYRLLIQNEGTTTSSASEWCERSYENKITDEFLEPAVITPRPIQPEDSMLFWNFRADRMRQIVRSLTDKDFSEFQTDQQISNALCFTEYDPLLKLPSLFQLPNISQHLGEVLSTNNKTQLRTAETEKYPHVTYFFNGGNEEEWPGEERTLIPSPRDVRTYDLKPEMSAYEVCEKVIQSIKNNNHDFILVNFANCDMVGHTGVLEATIKAVEVTDTCIGRIVEALEQAGGQMLLLADHGNADQMITAEGTPHTAHTLSPVPCIAIGNPAIQKLRTNGALCDVAPTILQMMNISQPGEMTGKSLIK